MKIVERKIDDLIPADYNPRKLTSKKKREITESLKEFGLVDPIVVNVHKDRKDIIVGGHQRSVIWKQMGNDTIPTVEVSLDLDSEKELNLRLNKNSADFDYDKVMELFDFDRLLEIGFGTGELPKELNDFEQKFNDIDTGEPTYPITPKFSESYNSVLIMCKTEMDYTWLKNALDIQRSIDYKSENLGDCTVIMVKEFQKKWKNKK